MQENDEAMIQMEYYLIISTLMFFIGIYGFITRKNMIAILISLELILNAVEINFAVFNRYLFPDQMEGMFFTLFGITITAAETAVALAIIINAYRSIGNIEIDNLGKMKE
ncbi:NADH-quinone oxidoreductase subunit K [Bacteroidia bacterium]|nr:NADH-quinone oxidoreductase subunit K [Bacteroidia bacterium]